MSGPLLPCFDEAAIRSHVEMVHALAEGLDGRIVVAAYGEDPISGRKIPGWVRHYAIGDVEGTVAAVMSRQAIRHSNVYMPLTVLRPDLAPGERGEKKDIVAVLGLVSDVDADHGTTPRSPPIAPSFSIESSPGNRQDAFLFERPLSVADAERLARALQRATQTDSGTADVAHVWRVPGAVNWPNATKLARGRSPDPVSVLVKDRWRGSYVSVTELERALGPWLDGAADRTAPKLPPPPEDEKPIVLATLPANIRTLVEHGTTGDRSAAFHKVVTSLWERGHSQFSIFDLLAEHPGGITEKYGTDDRLQREVDRCCEKSVARGAKHFDAAAAVHTEEPLEAPAAEAKFEIPIGPGPNVPIISEDEACIRFVEEYRGKLRYCHDHGAWFEWTGTIWRRNRTGIAFHWARELARRIAEDWVEKVRVSAGRAAFAGAVERFARTDTAFAVTAETWDRDPWLLGTPGGTVDLRTGILRPGRPEDGITRCTAVAPAFSADCPLWLRLLDETFGGDAATVRFFQQWLGYSLTGDTREQCLVFGHGSGGNGKGVTINTVGRIAGTYTVTAAAETFVAAFGSRHSTELAMLAGARIVKASEMEKGQVWAEKRIKELTGGDEITARFMRQDNFTFLPTFKLIIVGNDIPDLNNVDQAMRRRFNLLPFLHTPRQVDPALPQKLEVEWPAILRWMIDGCLDWQRNGLIRPEGVIVATQEYFADQDTFSQWAEERCTIDRCDEGLKEATARLYASWSSHAKTVGVNAGSEKAFVRDLRTRYRLQPRDKVPLPTGGRARGFVGVALKGPAALGDL